MKNKTLFIKFLSATTFAVACSKEKSISQQMEVVKAETAQAAGVSDARKWPGDKIDLSNKAAQPNLSSN